MNEELRAKLKKLENVRLIEPAEDAPTTVTFFPKMRKRPEPETTSSEVERDEGSGGDG